MNAIQETTPFTMHDLAAVEDCIDTLFMSSPEAVVQDHWNRLHLCLVLGPLLGRYDSRERLVERVEAMFLEMLYGIGDEADTDLAQAADTARREFILNYKNILEKSLPLLIDTDPLLNSLRVRRKDLALRLVMPPGKASFKSGKKNSRL